MTTSDSTSNADLKRCTKCGERKPLTEFHRDAKNTDGFRYFCKTCARLRGIEYRNKNADRLKQKSKDYYAKHKNERIAYWNKYTKEHPEVHKRACSKYAKTHPEKVRFHCRLYKARHRKHISAYNIEYRRKKHAAIRKQSRIYYYAHRAEAAAYHKNNPHVGRLGAQRRRARKRELPATFSRIDENQMHEYFGNKCAACGRPVGLWHTLALDHWIPLASPDCPGTVATNMVPLCHATKDGQDGCNNSKSDRNAHEWLVERFGKHKAAKIEKRIQEYFDSLQENVDAN